jgi:hypothetical protein
MRKILAVGLMVVLALGVSVLPVNAGSPRHGGGFNRGGNFHGGHGHFHGGRVFVGFGFYGGWPYYPYYGYPYPYYGYPYYSPPVVYTAPQASYTAPPPAAAEPPAVQREVVYPHGKYVLEGDGVNTPYRWVWISTTPADQQPPPPR